MKYLSMSVFESGQPDFYDDNYLPWTPDPSNCSNKFCQGRGQIPATGQNPIISRCGDVQTLEYERATTGGLTGRGVTPCPFGFIESTPWSSTKSITKHYNGQVSSMFFDLDRPSYAPPQGNPRSLQRIGYEWRNAN